MFYSAFENSLSGAVFLDNKLCNRDNEMPQRPISANMFYWSRYVKLDGCKIHYAHSYLIFTQHSYDHVSVYSL